MGFVSMSSDTRVPDRGESHLPITSLTTMPPSEWATKTMGRCFC